MVASIRTALRALAVTTALVAASLLAAPTAVASGDSIPVPLGEYVACGYGEASTTTTGCMTLPAAITAAASVRGDSTIILLPGTYCPFTLNSTDRNSFDRLTIEGAGVAGIPGPGPISFGGPEAALSTIKYASAFCGDTVPAADVNLDGGNQVWSGITLRNFAVEGAEGGPADGIEASGLDLPLTMRDMLVSGMSNRGVFYDVTNQFNADMSVFNSAFIDNGTGVDCPCEASIDGSTIAGNTTGLLHDGTLQLAHDTIVHNTTGVNVTVSGGQLGDSIIGANTTDCGGFGAASMEVGFSENNLLGGSCFANSAPTDIQLTGDVAPLDMTSQPTPSVPPPAQAIGAGDNLCGFTGTDQLEHSESGLSVCDIGSVESAPSGSNPTATPTPTVVDFGKVPAQQTAGHAITLTNTGAGLLAITQVGVTGTGFSIVSDGCTYRSLPSGTCTVVIDANSATPGDLSGTVAFMTNAGEQDVPLTATVTNPLAAPGTVHATAGYRSATVTWQASPSEVDAGVDNPFDLYYAVWDSTNGTDWNFAGEQESGTESLTVDQLTDNRAYTFRVCTGDFYTNDDTQKCSLSTPSATPHADASALTHPSSSTIKYGASATVTTKLTDHSTGAALVGATVTLRSRPAGSTATYTVVATKTTGTGGTASLTVKPTRNTQYLWQFIGAGPHSTTTSAAWTISVAQVVNAALVHTSVRHGTSSVVYGTVSPSTSGEAVSLQYWHGGKWVTLTSAKTALQTLPNHKHVVGYVLKHAFATKGSYQLRVSRAKTTRNAAGNSKTLALKVT